MDEKFLVIGLGEVLWDLLPSGKVLGGAPTNFAYMSTALGDEGVVASRIGNDSLGHAAQARLGELGLNTAYLQKDSRFQTGSATVSIDDGGQPTFAIAEPSAWDYLEWTADWRNLASRADIICFGSLAQRSPVSLETITRFLEHARPEALRIFDVNLRQSYYSAAILRDSLSRADIVKLTEHELTILACELCLDEVDEKGLALALLDEYELKLVCITRGANGSMLVSRHECVGHPGYAVRVVDAVGAGDAFTACLAHHFIRGYSLQEISRYANRFASWVATQPGATPTMKQPEVQHLLQICKT